MHHISSFVEQEDALLGVLTVRESITYALRLRYVDTPSNLAFLPPPPSLRNSQLLFSLPLLPRKQVNERVNLVIDSLGLQTCADQRIGTPIQRGISGGSLLPVP